MAHSDWPDSLSTEIDEHCEGGGRCPSPPPESPFDPSSPRDRSPNARDSWLTRVWQGLPERERLIMLRRTNGETLENIGSELQITRERVRQLQKKADDALFIATLDHGQDLVSRLAVILGDSPATPLEALAPELPAAPPEAQRALLKSLGIVNPRSWDGELTRWWTRKPDELNRRIKLLVDLAPLSHGDMRDALQQVGLAERPAVTNLLDSPNSKLARHDLGWYRPGRAARDLAFLYLQREGSPRAVAEVAAITGASEHAMRETMRRDDAFAQVRPEGTWALADWHVPGSDNRYRNAEETVIEVIRELGPISLPDLKREVIHRYPVSTWRVTQCLSSAMIGLTADGRYDLAERGAKPVEDTEPARPPTIEAKGHVVGVRLHVNHDLLRGSGIPVNRWLTWHLGLRIVPSLRTFTLVTGGEVTVKRASSNAQISSLRTAVQAMDLVDGCQIALILNTQSGAANIHHVCQPGCCPAA